MSYHQFRPDRRLAPFVEYIGIQESSLLTDTKTHVLPTNQLDLLIHFGEPFAHEAATGIEQLEPVAHLCGQRTRPYSVRATGKTGILICSFYPWGLKAFTQIPLRQLNDQTLDLDAAFPGINPLITQIVEATSAFTRVKLLETYLLSRLNETGVDCAMIQLARKLRDQNLPIHSLSQEFRLSKRQIDRRFIEATGLSPKKFSRIARFQRALGYRHNSAADVAALAGYFDQAHMHREFLEFSGRSPRGLFTNSEETELQRVFNNSNPNVSRFYNTLYL